MKILLSSAALLSALAIFVLTIMPASAQTPAPSPASGAATPASEVGLKHILEVTTVTGTAAADGAVVKIGNGALRPPANEKELEEAKGREYCAVATVKNGAAAITPEFSSDCPEGMPVVAFLFPSMDADTGIALSAEPAFEWRTARTGETPKTIVSKPIPPHASGGEVEIRPPSTGDAAMPGVRRTSNSIVIYFAFTAAALLGLCSVAVATVNWRRSQRT